MTINDLINKAGWYQGTERTWDRLPMDERSKLSFAATGCLIAYPTWQAPVNCCHIDCQIARGEVAPIEKTKGIMAYERESGWLRFMDETDYQKLLTAMLAKAEETKEYDAWELGWQSIVACGVMA